MTNLAKQAESLDAKKKHMQAFVDKFRFNAKRASLVQSRLKAIERLGQVQLGVCFPMFLHPQPPASAFNPHAPHSSPATLAAAQWVVHRSNALESSKLALCIIHQGSRTCQSTCPKHIRKLELFISSPMN